MSSAAEIWAYLIETALASQTVYSVFQNNNDLLWLKSSLLIVFSSDDSDSECKYRCLVYLNRHSSCGRYALLFNAQIKTAIEARNIELLSDVCKTARFSELEALSSERRQAWLSSIEFEIIVLNLYFDTASVRRPDVYSCDSDTSLVACREMVTVMFKNNNVIQTEHIISVSEIQDSSGIVKVFMMRELDLMFLLLSSGVNPYTGCKFKDVTVNHLTTLYADALILCKRAHQLGYRHCYKI
jgi:hypothetical protein